jgi:hypothetical protein
MNTDLIRFLFPFGDGARRYSVAPGGTADTMFSREEYCVSPHLWLSWIVGIHNSILDDEVFPSY